MPLVSSELLRESRERARDEFLQSTREHLKARKLFELDLKQTPRDNICASKFDVGLFADHHHSVSCQLRGAVCSRGGHQTALSWLDQLSGFVSFGDN